MIYYILSAVALVPWLRVLYNGAQTEEMVPHVKDFPDEGPGGETPARLSVVVAARNEAHTLEKALRSLARQDHPNLEIIVVNDRSTDATGDILDRVAAEFPDRIRAIHLTELPEGWLGKCNALQHAGEAATGDYILFTDADVEFEATALRRCHAYAEAEQADQLAVFPEMIATSFWEQAMLNVFGICFFIGFPPHKAMVRNSGRYVGVGAFNMVRTEMYRRVGGHRFLRLQVIDDVGLGKLVKFSGGVVRVAFGNEQVRIRWYDGVAATIRGLEKNFFASTNYSVVKTVLFAAGTVVAFIWPWIGIWTGAWGARVLAGIALLLQIALGAIAARRVHFSGVHGLTTPVGAVLLITAMLRSMIITLRNGGINWREHFYPLKDLRQFKL